MVPTSPYPNILASSKPKIIGFRNPMSHFAPTVAGCMSHLAHNPSNSWRDRVLFANRKMTFRGWRGVATVEEHYSKNWLIESLKPAWPVTASLRYVDYFPLARNPSIAVAVKKSVL
jgi:hypothetical protein